MRDIETLLEEAQEVVSQDETKQREWIDSLTDEEKASIGRRFNVLAETIMDLVYGT